MQFTIYLNLLLIIPILICLYLALRIIYLNKSTDKIKKVRRSSNLNFNITDKPESVTKIV